LIAEDVRAYAGRRWDLAEALKAGHWAREKAALGSLRIADSLRRHALRVRGGASHEADRADDLRAHVELGWKLRCVGSNRNGLGLAPAGGDLRRRSRLEFGQAFDRAAGPGAEQRGEVKSLRLVTEMVQVSVPPPAKDRERPTVHARPRCVRESGFHARPP
jgi:hypothetical protein